MQGWKKAKVPRYKGSCKPSQVNYDRLEVKILMTFIYGMLPSAIYFSKPSNPQCSGNIDTTSFVLSMAHHLTTSQE